MSTGFSVCALLKTSLVINSRTMAKQVFIDNIAMEAEAVFYVNGDINVTPCDFELGQHIVNGAAIVSQKGRMVTQVNGASHFRPFATGTGSRYRKLFSTPHGEVKETNGQVIVQFRFPKKYGKEYIEKLLREESEKILEFIRTRETETKW